MTTARKHAAWLLILLLLAGLFATNRLPPFSVPNVAQATGPASGATSNTINAISQQVALYVPAGGAVRLNVSGTFTGTLSFYLNQAGTSTAVNLYNLGTGSATDQSATGTGSWYYAPTSGNDGILTIQASDWTSGTAIVSLTDLIANPQSIDMVLLPSAARSGTVNVTVQNRCWTGIILYLKVTAGSTGAGPIVQVVPIDPATGAANSAVNPAPTAPTGPTTLAYMISPGASGSIAMNQTTQANLPATFNVKAAGDGTNSFTYSLGCSLLK